MDKGLKLFLAIIIPIAIVGTCFGVAGWYYHTKMGESLKKSVDETKLYIGVPLKNGDQGVDLLMTAKNGTGTYNKTVHSGDLQKLDGQDEELRFYDYASAPVADLGGKNIGLWLSDSANTLTVRTIGMSLVTSALVTIDKSGVWFVNVAAKDGGNPGVSHSYAYLNYVIG